MEARGGLRRQLDVPSQGCRVPATARRPGWATVGPVTGDGLGPLPASWLARSALGAPGQVRPSPLLARVERCGRSGASTVGWPSMGRGFGHERATCARHYGRPRGHRLDSRRGAHGAGPNLLLRETMSWSPVGWAKGRAVELGGSEYIVECLGWLR